MNELNIKYHNNLNYIPMEKFSAVEMDVFMSICLLMRDKGNSVTEISLSEIRKVSNFKPTSNERLEECLKSVQKKLRFLNYASISTDKFEGDIYLFTAFGRSKQKENTWVFSVNEHATYILNHLTSEWTLFSISEYTELSSRYSKTLFRFLKQWRSVGTFIISDEELRLYLDIPEGFTSGKISSRILLPAIKELSNYFEDLTLEKTYSSEGKGRPAVDSYSFKYTPIA